MLTSRERLATRAACHFSACLSAIPSSSVVLAFGRLSLSFRKDSAPQTQAFLPLPLCGSELVEAVFVGGSLLGAALSSG